MPNQVVSIIAPAGGDYTSLSAWEAAEQRDLVAADEIAIAEITGDWTAGADTTQVTVSGWTTDATRYIEIRTVGVARHSGRWTTSAYRLVSSTGAAGLNLATSNVRALGLQVERTGNAQTSVQAGIGVGVSGEFHVAGNLIRFTGTNMTLGDDADSGIAVGAGATGPTVKIWNNVVWDFFHGIDWTSGITGTTIIAYNNTIAGSADDGIHITGPVGDASVHLKNNIVQTSTASDYDVTSFTVLVTAKNISEDTSSPDSAYRSLTPNFVDSANEDFHLESDDPDALNEGDDLSADAQLAFGDDYDDHSRRGAWDIGADQFQALAHTSVIKEDGSGDYTTLAAWEAAEQRDLVHLGEREIGQIEGTWASAEDAAIVVAGWTTAKGNDVTIEAVGVARTDGTWKATAYRADKSTAGTPTLRIDQNNVRVRGIQVGHSGTFSSREAFRITGASNVRDDIDVEACVFRITGSSGTNSAAFQVNGAALKQLNSLRVWNCAVTESLNDGFDFGTGPNGGATSYNNTARDVVGTGFGGFSTRVLVKNCLSDNGGTDFNAASAFAGSDFNASSDATAPGGSSRINQTFTFVSATDPHLSLADGGAQSHGTDLSADGSLAFDTDVDGNKRPSSWDIGYDQVIPAGGGGGAMFNRGLT